MTSVVVLLAVITPATSGTRRAAALPARATLATASPTGSPIVFAGVDGAADRRHVQLLHEQFGDAVLLASQVFQGIDLIVRRAGPHPAYGFVIRPDARPDRIRLSMTGADRLEIDEGGDLLVHHAGRLTRQQRPRAHQETPGGQVEIRADYRIGPDGDVRFAVGAYDRSRALVIDPMLTFPIQLGHDEWRRTSAE